MSARFSTILGRLRWKAVLIGFVLDYGGSLAYGIASGIVLGILHAAHGATPSEIDEALGHSSAYLLSMLVVGSLFTAIGGFVVGRLAPRAPLFNATVFGVLNLLLVVIHPEGEPTWQRTAGIIVNLPCALVGAWLASLFFPHREAAPPPLPPVG